MRSRAQLQLVVLFPGTKDQSWRWQTTNQDYGRFYLALSSEALGVRCRHDELHAECNKKCEALSRQLYELKAELERLRIGGRLHSPRDGCRSPVNHNGDCNFAARARVPCDDMFHTTHDIDYNGGCRTEPQILEDHLKADHPRLVRKVKPMNPLGTSCFQKDSGSEQKIYGLGPTSIYWTKGQSTPDGGHTEARQAPPPGYTGSGPADSGHLALSQQHQSRTPDSGGGSYGWGSVEAGGGGESAGAGAGGGGRLGGGGGHRVKESPRARATPPRARDAPRARDTPPRARDTPRDTASDGGTTTTTTGRIVPKASNVAKTPRSATAPKERLVVGGGNSHRGGGGVEGLVSRNQAGSGSYAASQGGSEPRYAASRERDVVHHAPHTSLKTGGPQRKILPPSQRYNFYRYFGFAGQGAKTSRGWNPK